MLHGRRWLGLVRGGKAKFSRTCRAGIPLVLFLLYPRLLLDSALWITEDDQVAEPSGNGLSGRSWKLETSLYCGTTSKFPPTSSSCLLLTLRGRASWRPRTWMAKPILSQGNLFLLRQMSFPKRTWSDSHSSWIANLHTKISILTSRSCATPTQAAKPSKNP